MTSRLLAFFVAFAATCSGRRTRDAQRKLRAKRQELLLQIARLDGQQVMPIQDVSATRAREFAQALRAHLLEAKSSLAKRYLRALVHSVTVTEGKVEIRGPKAALAEGLRAYPKGHMLEQVPSSVQKWLPGTGSNRRPSD